MRKQLLLSLTLFASMHSSAFAQQVTVKSGDTLSGIASQYNISVRSIMDKNQIFNADDLEIGQKIVLPETAKASISLKNSYHTVKAGESLNKISSLYGIDKQTLISLNNFENPNHLYIGQKIAIPYKSNLSEMKNVNPDYHTVVKGETLIMISKKYKIPMKNLVSLNKLDNPNIIKPGTKLSLKSNSNDLNKKATNNVAQLEIKKDLPDWRNYGSLKINWANWKSLNGSYVTPAVNVDGKPLFIAVNCSTTRLNHTGKDNQWKQWFTPTLDFEFDLLENLCNSRAN